MSLQPATYEEAKLGFKPLKRSRMPRKASLRVKTSPARRGAAKKPKRKRLSVGKLKKRAWTEFSIYIRTFDADAEGMVKCCTCDSVKHWKEMQAGHFIPGRLNSNLFDERGTNVQCSLCNVVKGGNGPKYYQFMRDLYGEEVIDELMRQNDQTHKWLPGQLQSIWEKYKELNEANPLLQQQ
jgi:hypothetical protein